MRRLLHYLCAFPLLVHSLDLEKHVTQKALPFFERAVKRKDNFLASRGREGVDLSNEATLSEFLEIFPEKTEDSFVNSRKQRKDLLRFLSSFNVSGEVAVELGTYLGYTTRSLSASFGKVVTVEGEPFFSRLAQELNSDLENVEYISGHSASRQVWEDIQEKVEGGSWGDRVFLVVVDAGHDFEAVFSDIAAALSSVRPRFLLLDDFSSPFPGDEVRRASEKAEEAGWIRKVLEIGESTGFSYVHDDSVGVLQGPEAMLFEVVEQESAREKEKGEEVE